MGSKLLRSPAEATRERPPAGSAHNWPTGGRALHQRVAPTRRSLVGTSGHLTQPEIPNLAPRFWSIATWRRRVFTQGKGLGGGHRSARQHHRPGQPRVGNASSSAPCQGRAAGSCRTPWLRRRLRLTVRGTVQGKTGGSSIRGRAATVEATSLARRLCTHLSERAVAVRPRRQRINRAATPARP